MANPWVFLLLVFCFFMLICACVVMCRWLGGLGSDGWGGFDILVRSTEGVPRENWGEAPWQLETGSTLRGGEGWRRSPHSSNTNPEEPNDKEGVEEGGEEGRSGGGGRCKYLNESGTAWSALL